MAVGLCQAVVGEAPSTGCMKHPLMGGISETFRNVQDTITSDLRLLERVQIRPRLPQSETFNCGKPAANPKKSHAFVRLAGSRHFAPVRRVSVASRQTSKLFLNRTDHPGSQEGAANLSPLPAARLESRSPCSRRQFRHFGDTLENILKSGPKPRKTHETSPKMPRNSFKI